MNAADAFEPFVYSGHLWATTTKFVEFKGMEPLRKPLRSSDRGGDPKPASFTAIEDPLSPSKIAP
jgi:hypothetical protein